MKQSFILCLLSIFWVSSNLLAKNNLTTYLSHDVTVTSNIVNISKPNQPYAFAYCDNESNLIYLTEKEKLSVSIDVQCRLLLERNSKLFIVVDQTAKYKKLNNRLPIEVEFYEVEDEIYKQLDKLAEIKNTNIENIYLGESNTMYVSFREVTGISVFKYSRNTGESSKYELSVTGMEKPYLLSPLMRKNNNIVMCAYNDNNYHCYRIDDNTAVLQDKGKIKVSSSLNLVESNRNLIWSNVSGGRIKLCYKKELMVHCSDYRNNSLRNINQYKSVTFINGDGIKVNTLAFREKNKHIILNQSLYGVSSEAHKLSVEKSNDIQGNSDSLLSDINSRLSKNYPDMSLIDLTDTVMSSDEAGYLIDQSLLKNEITVVGGDPEFIDTIKPKSIAIWQPANLMLIVKENNNIYHLRTLNYREDAINSNKDEYLEQVANSTSRTIEKLREQILERKNSTQ